MKTKEQTDKATNKQVVNTTVTTPISPGELKSYNNDLSKNFDVLEGIIRDIDLDGNKTGAVKGDNDMLTKVLELKNNIVNLKSPTPESKDLHLNFILSLSAIEKFIELGTDESRSECRRLVQNVRQNYHEMINYSL